MKILTDKQEIAFGYLCDDLTQFLFYGGAAGGAKTWLGCFWLATRCKRFPGTRWFIGRDSLKDTRESVLVTWNKVCKKYGFIGWKYIDNNIHFDNDSVISFLDLSYYPQKDPFFERFGSKEYTGGWIEEAGEVHFDAFDVLKSRIGRHLNEEYNIKAKILITANPKKNWIYRVFYDPYRKGKLESNYAFVHSLYTDNDFLPEDYKDTLNQITDKIKRQRLIQGIFDYDDEDNSLIEFAKINDLFTNTYVPSGTKYMSCDLAITNDMFVCIVWIGMQIIDIFATQKIGAKEIVDKINQLRIIHQIPVSNIVYDADGLGGYMRSYLPGAVPLFNNSPSLSPEYKNLKACLNYKLADEINAGNIWINCTLNPKHKEMLCADLGMIKRSTEQDEKLGIMNKTIVKQILGRSPDFSDALAFRMLFKITRNS